MIGNKVCFFQSLKSTNSFMKTHLDEFRDGDMICAKTQTEGRGRRENRWISVEGNLHFSFWIENKESSTDFDVILKVTNALTMMFDSYGLQATIKYPNDLLINNKKIGGILVEHIHAELEGYIIGIGINVMHDNFDQLSFPATSIKTEAGSTEDYRDVLFEFIKAYNHIESLTREELYTRYLKRSILLGKKVLINNKEYLVKTINPQGELVLNDNGKEIAKGINEVTIKELYNE